MYSNKPHPVLAQVPLTVSPFISLPRAPTLPYTYKPLPSTLPPSSTASENGTERERYIIAPSGHAAHPDEIIASCSAIEAHMKKAQDDANKAIQAWENKLKEQELAEKRRVAPGWLDRDEKILEPEKAHSHVHGSQEHGGSNGQHASLMDQQNDDISGQAKHEAPSDAAGAELDRAFGGIAIQGP
ncbi:uncharacterized protein KY384_005130 [Bacidia gigantensis]|uniref:uncharacterized protein n=1 Tax=Bacidia gigantensis TaxID=2732470 RepID=UPI001D058E0A|nr:uncharacterized protein KY384_005130 [Bacidia gigantensis]KAG8529649.1 hypothetical protein KY384_005130 [Bacidia gigantensis]